MFLFPAASSYTSFQGLTDVVMLQYYFQDLVFSLLIVAGYLIFSLKYCALCLSLNSSMFLVLWNLLRRAFVLFLSILSSSVHHGTALYVLAFFEALCVLNDVLHAILKASLNSSMYFYIATSSNMRLASVSSRSAALLSEICWVSLVSAV